MSRLRRLRWFGSSRQLTHQLLVSIVLGCVVAYCAFSGLDWTSEVVAEQSSPPEEHAESRAQWFRSLKEAESGQDISPALAHPMNLPVLVQRPPGALGHLAFSREDLYPSVGTINGFSNEALIFRRYELEGPSVLQQGNLDMAFAVVLLMPLALCLLNYNQLASDREAGILRVVLVHGADSSVLLWQRVIVSSLLPLLVVVLASIVSTFLVDSMSRSTWLRLLAWCGAVVLYWCSWVSLCALVAASCKRSLSAALVSVTVWVAVAVVLPACFQFYGSFAVDPPSKIRILALARSAEASALQSVDQRVEAFMAEHSSELAQDSENFADYYRRAYLSNSAVNDSVESLFDAFDMRLQDDFTKLNFLQAISPASACFRALQEIAGTGFHQAYRFEREVREFFRRYFDSIGAATLTQQRLSISEAESIGSFIYEERPDDRTIFFACIALLLFTIALASIATRVAHRIDSNPN